MQEYIRDPEYDSCMYSFDMLATSVLMILTFATLSQGYPDTCSLPIEPGPCLAYIPTWGFNATSQRCVKFIYGGCQGNKNRFDSVADCRRACCPSQGYSDTCRLPIEPGPCLAFITKWGFDTKYQKCLRFAYSGCQGNENRFDSLEECNHACNPDYMFQSVNTSFVDC